MTSAQVQRINDPTAVFSAMRIAALGATAFGTRRFHHGGKTF
jgi:hypothetical protein